MISFVCSVIVLGYLVTGVLALIRKDVRLFPMVSLFLWYLFGKKAFGLFAFEDLS